MGFFSPPVAGAFLFACAGPRERGGDLFLFKIRPQGWGIMVSTTAQVSSETILLVDGCVF